jgi:hypothetical protein
VLVHEWQWDFLETVLNTSNPNRRKVLLEALIEDAIDPKTEFSACLTDHIRLLHERGELPAAPAARGLRLLARLRHVEAVTAAPLLTRRAKISSKPTKFRLRSIAWPTIDLLCLNRSPNLQH